MRKFIIATHRTMAEGLFDTIQFFSGIHENIEILSAYINENEICDELIKKMMVKEDSDEIVIFTDISSGSVTQKFYPYLGENVYMISGINLPVLLSLVLSSEKKLSVGYIDKLVSEAREQLKQIVIQKNEEDSDE